MSKRKPARASKPATPDGNDPAPSADDRNLIDKAIAAHEARPWPDFSRATRIVCDLAAVCDERGVTMYREETVIPGIPKPGVPSGDEQLERKKRARMESRIDGMKTAILDVLRNFGRPDVIEKPRIMREVCNLRAELQTASGERLDAIGRRLVVLLCEAHAGTAFGNIPGISMYGLPPEAKLRAWNELVHEMTGANWQSDPERAAAYDAALGALLDPPAPDEADVVLVAPEKLARLIDPATVKLLRLLYDLRFKGRERILPNAPLFDNWRAAGGPVTWNPAPMLVLKAECWNRPELAELGTNDYGHTRHPGADHDYHGLSRAIREALAHRLIDGAGIRFEDSGVQRPVAYRRPDGHVVTVYCGDWLQPHPSGLAIFHVEVWPPDKQVYREWTPGVRRPDELWAITQDVIGLANLPQRNLTADTPTISREVLIDEGFRINDRGLAVLAALAQTDRLAPADGNATADRNGDPPQCPIGIGEDLHDCCWKAIEKLPRGWFRTGKLAEASGYHDRRVREWCKAMAPVHLEHNGRPGNASMYRRP